MSKLTLKNTALGTAFAGLFLMQEAFSANVPPSQLPPAGIAVEEAPLFVAIAFDDNGLVDNGTPDHPVLGGQAWVLDLWARSVNPTGTGNVDNFDGQVPHTTFFNLCSNITSDNWNASVVKQGWRSAMLEGHEMANHTMDHLEESDELDAVGWQQQVEPCTALMSKPFNPDEGAGVPDDQYGIGAAPAIGFRAPYLRYNANLYDVLLNGGFKYDASIAEGYHWEHNGTNFYWPYTLDNGSPGADLLASWGTKPKIGQYPGLWEVPTYAMVVPADEQMAAFGLDYSLRNKMAETVAWFDVASGKVESSDYNLFYQFGLNKAEVLAILKNTLDLRLAGNRAPLTFLAHSDYYADIFDTWVATTTTASERRAVLEEFLAYALAKPEVRLVSHEELVAWMEKPQALNAEHCYHAAWESDRAYVAGEKVIYNNAQWQASWWSFNGQPEDVLWGSWVKVMDCE
ncbi:hypothetical protein [Microbulbifer aggregans]|uniref:hypothetical protein n=1 Tax=Microbulbifer aggregans TaxID=1769779 RepID=UPI001CFE9863|nr:hypothetical protein [Microbulbifer aggregans]